MIIKIDSVTESKLDALKKEVSQKIGLTPQSNSLMVQVLLEWALKRVKGTPLDTLAPKMVSFSQRRKAAVAKVIEQQKLMSEEQIEIIMKAIEKKDNKLDSLNTPSTEKQT